MYKLGALEEMVILLAAAMKEEAYAVSIAREYTSQTTNEISIPAIHTVLKRLEDKGLLKSYESSPTAERGGRKKRIYQITNSGYRLVSDLRDQREKLWTMIPKMSVS